MRGRKRGTVKPLIFRQFHTGVIIVRINIEPDALRGRNLPLLNILHLAARLIQSVDENLDLSVSQPTVTKLLLDGIQLRASLILGENIDLSLRQTEPLSQSRSILDLVRRAILGLQNDLHIPGACTFKHSVNSRLHLFDVGNGTAGDGLHDDVVFLLLAARNELVAQQIQIFHAVLLRLLHMGLELRLHLCRRERVLVLQSLRDVLVVEHLHGRVVDRLAHLVVLGRNLIQRSTMIDHRADIALRIR